MRHLIFVLLLTGCTSRPAIVEITNGNRNAGTVTATYVVDKNTHEPKAPVEEGIPRATRHCRVWGYMDAIAFGSPQKAECLQERVMRGCVAQKYILTYQCH